MLAEKWNITPFDVLEKDIDDFILIVNNSLREGGANAETVSETTENKKVVSNKYDGFWDM